MYQPIAEIRHDQAADEIAVRALYQQLMEAWNRGSGADYAAVFASDGVLVGFDGTAFHGRRMAGNSRLFKTLGCAR